MQILNQIDAINKSDRKKRKRKSYSTSSQADLPPRPSNPFSQTSENDRESLTKEPEPEYRTCQ